MQVEKKFLVLEHFSTPGCVFSTHFSKCLFLVSGRECARPAGERFPGELTGFAFLISGDGSSEAPHVVSAFIVDKGLASQYAFPEGNGALPRSIHTGTFLPSRARPVKHLAAQLSADPACLRRYLNRPSSHREHAGEIQCHLGYRDFNDQPGHFRLLRWLYTRAWLSGERPTVLFDLTTAR